MTTQTTHSALKRWWLRWRRPLAIALIVDLIIIAAVVGFVAYKTAHPPCPATVWQMIDQDYRFPRKEFYPKGCKVGAENRTMIVLNHPESADYTADYVRYHEDSGTTVFENKGAALHVYQALTETGEDLWPEQLHPRSRYLIRCRAVQAGITVEETYTDTKGVVVEFGDLTICQRGFIYPLSVNDRFTIRR